MTLPSGQPGINQSETSIRQIDRKGVIMYRHCVTDPPPPLISPLVTADMAHAHGHGSAPDHHERTFITLNHGDGGGPVPVAASPHKWQIVPFPNLGVKLGDNKIANFHIPMYDFVDSRQL